MAPGYSDRGDLKARSLDELRAAFGSAGDYYHQVARGIDERPVRAHRERKSIGAETTFSQDTSEYAVLAERLQPCLDKVWAVATAKAVVARTVTLKLKFSDFAQITRARSLPVALEDRATLEGVSLGLLREAFPLRRSVRLIGAGLSSLQAPSGDDEALSSSIFPCDKVGRPTRHRRDGACKVRRGPDFPEQAGGELLAPTEQVACWLRALSRFQCATVCMSVGGMVRVH